MVLNTSSKFIKPIKASAQLVPTHDILDVKDNSFYNIINDMYTKYSATIKDNIKKINSPSVNKGVMRIRTLMGVTEEGTARPASNNVYADLHPAFYVFGLILPHLGRIIQVDMYGMFEQLSSLSENKQMTENETNLIKMCVMNDVKIMDLDDMPLTREQQLNLIVYLNIFIHVVANSLFKIEIPSLPKMVEQSLINQFNSILDTKFKLPSIYNKLNDNDPYHIKVLRKTMLAFGIRPVKIKLNNFMHNYDKVCISSDNINNMYNENDNGIDDFVDSVTVPFNKIDSDTYHDEKTKHFSIKKFLDKYSRMITVENRTYWTQFVRGYGILPVYISRRDNVQKKDYEQLLVPNIECCETKIKARQILESEIFCPESTMTDSGFVVNSVTYYPIAIMGTFSNNSDFSGIIEDVEFLFVNPFNALSSELFISESSDTSSKDTTYNACKNIVSLFQTIDEKFFCGSKNTTNKPGSECQDIKSLSNLIKNMGDRTCTATGFEEFKNNLEEQSPGLLYLSNRCSDKPLFVTIDNSKTTASLAEHVVTLSQIKCLIQSSATCILYLTDVDC